MIETLLQAVAASDSPAEHAEIAAAIRELSAGQGSMWVAVVALFVAVVVLGGMVAYLWSRLDLLQSTVLRDEIGTVKFRDFQKETPRG